MDKCPVTVHQDEWELSQLLDRYRALPPRRVLEIGTLAGGTLWHWMINTPPGGEFVVIDLPAEGHPDYAQQRAGHVGGWQDWAEEYGHKLSVILAPSQAPATVAQVTEHAPFDFVFIDADHSYEAVRRDFESYRPLVRPGGLIALHDIDILEGPHFGVKPLWDDISQRYESDEWIANPGWWGIGVIRVP